MNMYMYVCILCGTTIVSDCWGFSIRLDNEGLMNHPVELYIGFVDSCTGAHTNTIEATWKYAKFTSGLTEKTRLNV